MKPWLMLGLAGALAGAAAAGPATAAAPAGPQQAEMTLLATRKLMTAPAAPALGSGFTSGGELSNPETRAPIGEGYSHCGVVNVSTAVPPAVTTHCTSVFTLPDGQLHLSGMRTYRTIATGFDDTTVSITGGTGAYRTARGDGTVTRTSGRDAAVVYQYVLDVATD